MARVLLIAALVAALFWVFTIVDCAIQPATRHRGVSKPAWIVIVVLLPVVGGLLWFAVGRTGRRSAASLAAPDDDPDFLRRIGATTADRDERIRRLEQELARLDSEDEAASGSGGDADETPARHRRDGDDDPRPR